MIIDLILNRKEGKNINLSKTNNSKIAISKNYNPKTFYNNIIQYGDISNNIALAMDEGTEKQVKTSLNNYIIKNKYNLTIINYINSVNWL